MKLYYLLLIFCFTQPVYAQPSLIVLGTIQDAGSPQIGCNKKCCRTLFNQPDPTRKVVSLGLFDKAQKKTYLFEATPDITSQLSMLKTVANSDNDIPDGIFLTHAHIGHYTGLMYLGREAINASNASVYLMPKMKKFLSQNGPWDQLVNTNNILLKEMQADRSIQLHDQLQVIPFLVPHRDEYSETVGYKIIGPNKKALFIPDIDKWEKWDRDISAEIANVDYAFIDATFYDTEELNNRDIRSIPHPFIIESMKRFSSLSVAEKKKIYFIHFNHTNPALLPNSVQAKKIKALGFNIARFKDVFPL